MTAAYYNEFDPFAAQWLRNLIAAGHIAPGDVDERSIEDVRPNDISRYTQCHFFAGIGIWSHALRSAGWDDQRPVWTGSCPCQPFSAAGKGAGFADERHLWPAFHHLVRECRPPIVIGEQVGGSRADGWVDLVQADLETEGYAFGIVETCAAGFGEEGVGGFHIRQRNYWLAHANNKGSQGRVERGDNGEVSGVQEAQRQPELGASVSGGPGESERLAHTDGRNPGAERQQPSGQHGQQQENDGAVPADRSVPAHSLGRDVDWLLCRDAKWRPVESGTFPLVDAYPQRVGVLRAAGNALDAAQAKGFCEAVLACVP